MEKRVLAYIKQVLGVERFKDLHVVVRCGFIAGILSISAMLGPVTEQLIAKPLSQTQGQQQDSLARPTPTDRPTQIAQASQAAQPSQTAQASQAALPTQPISSSFPASGYAPHPDKPLPQYLTDTPLPVTAWDSKNQRLFTLTFEPRDSKEQLWDSRIAWLTEYNRSGVQQRVHRLEFDSFEPQRMDIHPITGGLVFWDDGVGSVHLISGLSQDEAAQSDEEAPSNERSLDDALPPVLRADLSEGLTRVDRSFPHRNMYDHAAVLTPYQIITYGGYGNWFYKQLMIYLDEVTLEWLLVPQAGDLLPPRGARAQLFQYPFIGYGDTDERSEEDLDPITDPITVGEVPLWLLHPQVNEEGEPASELKFQQFMDRTWQEPVDIQLPNAHDNLRECVESFKASVVHKQPGTYRLDPNRSTLAVYDHCGELVFIHPESMTAYAYEPTKDSYNDPYHYSQAFYDPTVDNWIIFHFHMEPAQIESSQMESSRTEPNQTTWTPRPVSTQEFTAEEIASLTLAGPTIAPNTSPLGFILITLSSTLGLFGLVMWVRRRQQKPLTFKRVNGHIKITKGIRPVNEIHRQDSVALFTMILRKHPFQREQLSWTIQEFDQALGFHELSPSIRNTKREEILSHFNSFLSRLKDRSNTVCLEQHSDPQDKRKKIITFHTKTFPHVITQGFTQSVK
ncbi:MAG: hypothetical protein RI513_03365 [Balneolaceae bacterium]|nr:hypothetical protein [Balneolaceae bacterium]